jgi:hypothetical protein
LFRLHGFRNPPSGGVNPKLGCFAQVFWGPSCGGEVGGTTFAKFQAMVNLELQGAGGDVGRSISTFLQAAPGVCGCTGGQWDMLSHMLNQQFVCEVPCFLPGLECHWLELNAASVHCCRNPFGGGAPPKPDGFVQVESRTTVADFQATLEILLCNLELAPLVLGCTGGQWDLSYNMLNQQLVCEVPRSPAGDLESPGFDDNMFNQQFVGEVPCCWPGLECL